MSRFRSTARLILFGASHGLLAVATCANAQSAPVSPTLSITSPAPGQAVVGVTPTVSISYTADPSLAIDTSTLSVLINGINRTARFAAGDNGASYTLTVADGLVAGRSALRITASVRDTAGAVASDSREYDVLPILEAVSPATGFAADSETGRRGETINVGGTGLDPSPANNALRFRSLFLNAQGQFDAIDAPFVSVVDDRTKGQIEVPEGAVSGDISLVVNDAESRQTLPFEVQPAIEYCGTPHQILPLPTGGFLVWMINTTNSVSPRCPGRLQNVLLHYDENGITVLEDPNPNNEFWTPDIVGVALDKTGTHYALLLRPPVFGNQAWELTIRYKGIETKLPFAGTLERDPSSAAIRGSVGGTAVDFGGDGHLYIAYSEAEWVPQPPWDFERYVPVSLNVGMISKETLAAGGKQTLQPVLSAIAPTGLSTHPSRRPGRLRIRCDGVGYVSAMDDSNGIVKILSLKGPGASIVLGDIDPAVDEVVDIVPTVASNEILGTGWKIIEDDNRSVFWRAVGSGASHVGETRQDPIPLLTVTPAGTTLMYYSLDSIPGFISVAGFRVAPQDIGVGQTAIHYPCPCQAGGDAGISAMASVGAPACPVEEKLKILHKTTRWRPQRETASGVKDIQVVFSGPEDLEKAELTVEGPSDVPQGQTPLPSDYKPTYSAPFDPAKKTSDGDYQLVWNGPWKIKDSGGKEVPLPRGNYKLTVKGKRKDSTEEIKNETPYDKVSFVEVTSVQICEDDEHDACTRLTTPYPGVSADNPRVDLHDEEKDVSTRVARRGGGWRVFAEAPSEGAASLDDVKVLVTIAPPVPEDVRVHLRLLDVDDPDGSPIDKDGDRVDDTCLAAKNCVNDNDDTGTLPRSIVVAAEAERAKARLTLSQHPGDNYRVAASTTATWLRELRADQPSDTGDVLDGNGQKLAEDANLSKMVTVWRTLNLEIDSMSDPPADPTNPERNFIHGRITRLEGHEDHIARIFVKPESSPPMIGLRDASADLSDRPAGQGRFELGTIRVGTGDAATVIEEIDGNGIDYLERAFFVPYVLVDAFDESLSIGNVVSADAAALSGDGAGTFTLNPVLRSWADAQSRATALVIGGVRWPVLNVDPTRITPSGTVIGRVLVRSTVLPFSLRDDDVRRKGPFDIDTTLIQDTDVPSTNVFAAAYIRPRRVTVDNKARAPFNRNVECPPSGAEDCDVGETTLSIGAGRDTTPSSNHSYWVSFVQGAYQAGEKVDNDPNAEGTDTIVVGATVVLTLPVGSNIYVEALNHDLVTTQARARLCREVVVPHELGHQFGIVEDDPTKLGLMNRSCYYGHRFFDDWDLRTIRERGPVPEFGVTP